MRRAMLILEGMALCVHELPDIKMLLLPLSSPVCFKVFDVDRDGVLSRAEIQDMVVALLEVWKDNRTDSLPVSTQWAQCWTAAKHVN